MSRHSVLATLLVVAMAGSVGAQSPVLAEMFGRGVHQYYAGQLDAAHESLTMAIDAGSDDPRAYYFRGLVYAATGRTGEAEKDWAEAARLETTSPLAGLVGQSLRRVQGATRLQLEQVRQQVRLKERATLQAQARARAQELRQVEPQVLRRGAPPVAGTPGTVRAPSPAVAAEANPFRRDQTPPAQVVQEDALLNPFGDDAAAPAAGGAAAPTATPPAGGDPFSAPAPAGEADPFESPVGADPFGAPAPTSESEAPIADPFGNP